MPNLAYLLSPKISDRATLSGSATVANSGVSNLQNPDPRIRTIFTGLNCNIEGDFGALYPISGAALGFITATASTDVVHFRAGTTYPATVSPLVDTGAVTIWHPGSDLSSYKDKHRQFEFDTRTVRYFRFDLSCAAPPEIGRLFVGLRVEPEQNVMAWSPGGSEPIASTIDMGNQESRRRVGGVRRSIRMEWPALSKLNALGKIYELLLERGQARDFLASLAYSGEETINPLAYVYAGCGQLNITPNTLTHYFQVSLDMMEMAPLRML